MRCLFQPCSADVLRPRQNTVGMLYKAKYLFLYPRILVRRVSLDIYRKKLELCFANTFAGLLEILIRVPSDRALINYLFNT